jgi:hypothetical protein
MLCPISCAIIVVVKSPKSSIIENLFLFVQIPPTTANPERVVLVLLFVTTTADSVRFAPG